MFKLITFVSICTVSTASLFFYDVLCPKLNAIDDFNMTAYTGVWYDIYHYSNFTILNMPQNICPTMDFRRINNTFSVKVTAVENRVQTEYNSTMVPVGNDNEVAKLMVTIPVMDCDGIIWKIVATDYEKYSIVYVNDPALSFNTTGLAIIVVTSRTKTLEGEAKKAVNDYLASNFVGFDFGLVKTNDFTEAGCAYDSTKQKHLFN